MKFLKIISFFLIFIAFVTAPVSAQIAVGDSAITFSLPDTSGQLLSLQNYAGDIILLNFFATWCPPCQVEAPQLEDSIWQVYQNVGVTVIGLDLQEPPQIVANFINQNGLSYPILLDTAGTVFASYGAAILPTNIIINREGYVAWVEAGFDIPRLIQKIDSLLSITAIPHTNNIDQMIENLTLTGNYPNPFNSSTQIAIYLKQSSLIHLKVYDITGRMFLAQKFSFGSGENTIQLGLENQASGIYFYSLQAKAEQRMGRLILQK